MFKEILHIIPKLSADALNAMDRTLSGRFGKIAKKFGGGLVSALKGGALAGAALGLIDKLLSPLKEIQESIDKTLDKSDNLATNAKQFGTTSGRLARLQAIAESKGVDPATLDTILIKFQTAIAEAAADPSKPSAVRAYAKETDIAAAFFEFSNQLRLMNPNDRTLIQKETFGEKYIGKTAELFQTDLTAQGKKIGGPTADALTKAVDKLDNVGDLRNDLRATVGLNDLLNKSKIINESMVESQVAREKRDLEIENGQIKSYTDLAAISAASSEVVNILRSAATGLAGLITNVTNLAKNVEAFSKSRFSKGILSIFGGDK